MSTIGSLDKQRERVKWDYMAVPEQAAKQVPPSMDAEDLIRQDTDRAASDSFKEMEELMQDAPAGLRAGDSTVRTIDEGLQRSTVTQKEDRSSEYSYNVEGSEGFYAELASEYGVPSNRLRQLVESEGVKPADLQDILGARQILTIRDEDYNGVEREPIRRDAPSLRVLTEGYHVVGGNLTQYRRLVEAASEGVGQTLDNKTYHFMPGQASTIFSATVDKFLDGQLRVGLAPLAPGISQGKPPDFYRARAATQRQGR